MAYILIHTGMRALHQDLRRWRQYYRSLNGGHSGSGVFGCGIIVHSPGHPGQVDFHRQDAGTLVWLLQGGGHYSDERGRQMQIRAGDAFFRHLDLPHSSRADDQQGPWIEFFIHLPRSSMLALYDCGPLDRDCLHWQLGHSDELLNRARDLLDAMPDEAGVGTADCHFAMLDFIKCAWQIHRQHDRTEQTLDPIAQAAARLRSHLHRSMNIESLAAELGIGFEQLRKQFRQREGISPAAYRRRCCMQRAEILLKDADSSISAIAEAVGYADIFAFSKAFKKHSGLSPRAWRQGKCD